MSTVSHNLQYWGDPVKAEAKRLGLGVEWLLAISSVEVGVIAHPGLGAPVIRFEVHCFEERTGGSKVVQLRDAPTKWHNEAHWYKDDKDADWEKVHSGSQSDEWGALIRCMEEAPDIAWLCASYGVGQLMGWHRKHLGYSSAREMAGHAMMGGVPVQIEQWGKHIERYKDGAMLQALKSGNLKEFVRLYNGPGQIDYYAGAIQKRYDEAVQVLANPPAENIDHLYDEIKERQQALIDLGYGKHLEPWGADGSWGEASKKALKKFQEDHGLNPDGWWGKYTMEHVHAALLKRAA